MEALALWASKLGLVCKASRGQAKKQTTSPDSLKLGNPETFRDTVSATGSPTARTHDAATSLVRVRNNSFHAEADKTLIQLLTLPMELQLMIFSHLDYGDIQRLRRTCRSLRQHISKREMRRIFPNVARCIFLTCSVCLRSDETGNSTVVAPRSLSSHWSMMNICVNCTALNDGFMVGMKYLMVGPKYAWICRWCGFPITSDCARNQPEFHPDCRRKYHNQIYVHIVCGIAQFVTVMTATGLCASYSTTDFTIAAPGFVNLLLAIWASLILLFRRFDMRSYHLSLIFETAILCVWVVPIWSLVRRFNKPSFIPSDRFYATMLVIFGNMAFRLSNAIGNLVLLCDYKWWRRFKPEIPWYKRLMHKILMGYVVWTYPMSVEQDLPLQSVF